jgi:tetratricopeptide (TPR) repeat protein/6-pyruvoyl-tetrahydropterin synthase
MASVIHGYEYDIFISYRQKDNKYDGWVTEFVDNLKRELEATFKEDVSVYFDINPHDGLLETHDVDASLKEKLKCLVFIPIISRTYCDPKSFAWEHEFKAFVESALNDQFGLKVKLPNGNVANRVLPVRIHDLDTADIKLCESVLGGVLRGIEFIYKEPGVNRSLTPKDKEKKNLNGTIYRNQINKVALAIKEIILGLQIEPGVSVKGDDQHHELFGEDNKVKKIKEKKKTVKFNKRKLQTGVAILALIIFAAVLVWPKIFKRDILEKLASSGEKISIAVMPFQNMTNDTTFNYWQELIQTNLISALGNTGELRVRQKDIVNTLLQTQGNVQLASISPTKAGTISKKLEANIFINGNIQKAGTTIRIGAQLIDTKTMELLKSFELNRSFNDSTIIVLSDSLRKKVIDFLLISKLIKENLVVQHLAAATNSPEALKYYILGYDAEKKWDLTCIDWYLKALEADSNYFDPMMMLSDVYSYCGQREKGLQLVIKIHKKRDQWPLVQQLQADWLYATEFESLEEQIKYQKLLQQLDDQRLDCPLIIGGDYNNMHEYKKAIPELEKALEIFRKLWSKYFPGNNNVYNELGKSYHKTGQYEKEKKLYKIAEQDCPDDPLINLRQAMLSLAEKDSVTANLYIKKYINIKKRNSSSEANIASDLAWSYWQADLPEKAEEYYRKAISLDPENPVLLNDFACFLRDNNRNPDEFIEIIDKAIKLAPNKWDYYNYSDTKGWGLYKQGEYKEALDIYQKILNEIPYKLYTYKSRFEEVKKVAGSQM